jgi:hypothetical protein
VAGIGPRSPLGRRMRRMLVEPPRTFAAEVAARRLPTTVLVTEPGSPVTMPPSIRPAPVREAGRP